jgi:hypothetical protein
MESFCKQLIPIIFILFNIRVYNFFRIWVYIIIIKNYDFNLKEKLSYNLNMNIYYMFLKNFILKAIFTSIND